MPTTIGELEACLQQTGVDARTNGPDNLLVTGDGPDDKFLISTAAIDEQLADAGDWWAEQFPAVTREKGLQQAASYLAAGIDLNSAAELAANKRVDAQLFVDYGADPGAAPFTYPRVLLTSAHRTFKTVVAGSPAPISSAEDLARLSGLSVDAVQTAFDYRRYGRSLKMLERPSPEATFEHGQYGDFLVLYALSPDSGALSTKIQAHFKSCLPYWGSDDGETTTESPSASTGADPQSDETQAPSGDLACGSTSSGGRSASGITVPAAVAEAAPVVDCSYAIELVGKALAEWDDAENGAGPISMSDGSDWNCGTSGCTAGRNGLVEYTLSQ